MVVVLLIALLQGCAENGKREQTRAPIRTTEKNEESEVIEEENVEKTGSEKNYSGAVSFIIPNIESISIQGENRKLLYIYIRNIGESINSINKSCFEWYLGDKYKGKITELYSGDCKTEACEWKHNQLLCICIKGDDEFTLKIKVKLVMICPHYKEIEFIVESKFFLNSQVYII